MQAIAEGDDRKANNRCHERKIPNFHQTSSHRADRASADQRSIRIRSTGQTSTLVKTALTIDQLVRRRTAMQATMPRMSSMRKVVAGSPNHSMPTITVPIAPIPPQTAYAVPIGIERAAYSSRPMLIVTDTRNAIVQGMLRKFST